ncbi:hypothetical protein EGW08_010991 [Elysia chlorotica]|uniref:Uncharacterized protein n=1 Tax=Elysia chlorotica TaxID=188477 RepID=A0A433TI70_ELYCH|nr:hypothetical protein EGW08_010991 [Elysia chlorotica]
MARRREGSSSIPSSQLYTTNADAESSPFGSENTYGQESDSTVSSVPQRWHSVHSRQQNSGSPSELGNSQVQIGPLVVTRPPSMRHAFQGPTRSSPRLICKSLVSLSGGMDQWCSDNCNANFCPANTCFCFSDGEPARVRQDRLGPTPRTASVDTYQQGYGRPAQTNYPGYNTAGQSGSIVNSNLPQISPYLSNAAPHAQSRNRLSATMTNRHTLTPNSLNKQSPSVSTFKGNQVASWENGELSNHQHQNLIGRHVDSLAHTLREPSDFGLNFEKLNVPYPGHSMQTVISSNNEYSFGARNFERRKFPPQQTPAVFSSTQNPTRFSSNNDESRIDTHKRESENGKHIERTIPYSGFSYEANRNFVQDEAASPRPSRPSHMGCVAIGAYSGLQHFDEWCNVTCKQTMCPLLLCSCSGYGYN